MVSSNLRHHILKPGPGERWCPECNGEGHYTVADQLRGYIDGECDECEGTGIVDCDDEQFTEVEHLGPGRVAI